MVKANAERESQVKKQEARSWPDDDDDYSCLSSSLIPRTEEGAKDSWPENKAGSGDYRAEDIPVLNRDNATTLIPGTVETRESRLSPLLDPFLRTLPDCHLLRGTSIMTVEGGTIMNIAVLSTQKP